MSAAVDLSELGALVELPDETSGAAAAEAVTGLGRLGDLVGWLAAAQGHSPAAPPARPRLLVVTGDHPLASSVTSRPGPLGKLPDDTTVRVSEVTLPGIAPGDSAATLAAFERGRDLADAEADAGTDLLLVVCRGHGSTTVASALSGLLTNTDVATVTGRGQGIDDNTWMEKATIVRDLVRDARPRLGDQLGLLTAMGSDVAALTCGLLLQAAIRRTPVIVDGALAPAAGLVAQRIAYRAPRWWQVADACAEPSHTPTLDRLDLRPVLDLRTNGDDGFAALLVAHALAAAVSASA